MVEVFKTNISKVSRSKALTKKLVTHFPECLVNVDMQDCDHVLRVEGSDICPIKIVKLVTAEGFECEPLT